MSESNEFIADMGTSFFFSFAREKNKNNERNALEIIAKNVKKV